MAGETREEIPLTKLFETVLPYQANVYVTVLNIIQCIALAFWINEARDIIAKEELSLAWVLRSSVVLTIILVVWHRYVSELQYIWPITWIDTFAPFLIGIIECVIIFSINPKTMSLGGFTMSIIVLQFFVIVAYRNAYYKRKMKFTEKLYQSFYSDYPQFSFHLMNFLKGYDLWHYRVFTVFFGIYCVFLMIIILFSNDWNEIIFPIIFLGLLVQGEVFNNFQKALRKDKFVGPYFS